MVQARYVPHSHAHYGGGLLDGAYVLGLFGDAATELCIREAGDEGLFAGYEQVSFLAPVLAGDIVEVRARITDRGRRSRRVEFSAHVRARADPQGGPSAARVCEPRLLVVTAVGTVVVPS